MKNFEQSFFLNKKIAVALISSYASLQVPAIAVGDSLPTTYVVQSEPVISRSITTASGLQYYDAIVGTGDTDPHFQRYHFSFEATNYFLVALNSSRRQFVSCSYYSRLHFWETPIVLAADKSHIPIPFHQE